MDFKFELLPPEIRLVIDTERGEQYIAASAEQLLAELPHAKQAELLKEIARVYASNNGGGALADRIVEIAEESMAESGARGMINTLVSRYMR